MKTIYTELALYVSKNECARTDNVFFPHIWGLRWYGFPFKYVAPSEICNEKNCFDRPIVKWELKQILDVESSMAGP